MNRRLKVKLAKDFEFLDRILHKKGEVIDIDHHRGFCGFSPWEHQCKQHVEIVGFTGQTLGELGEIVAAYWLEYYLEGKSKDWVRIAGPFSTDEEARGTGPFDYEKLRVVQVEQRIPPRSVKCPHCNGKHRVLLESDAYICGKDLHLIKKEKIESEKLLCACRDCVHFQSTDNDPNGRGYCSHFNNEVPAGWLCKKWHREGVKVSGRKKGWLEE